MLDTHALVWAVTEPHLLSDAARDVIEDASADLSVSAVNAFEVGVKFRSGKLDGAAEFVNNFDRARRRIRATELPITAAHGGIAGTLDWTHKDPFDRLLAAQAIVEGLTLITSDRALRAFPAVRTLW